MIEARHWIISGKVQGVGFRPFVYKLALQLELRGWVRNIVGQVEIQAEGSSPELDAFHRDLIDASPTISDPVIKSCVSVSVTDYSDFCILQSDTEGQADIHVPPDYFTCSECLGEMQNPDDRRYRYPFINCTQCGPRYTLIESLPYDRPNTSMDEFPLCDDCREEYDDPTDRRFHAEPLACPVCGPRLSFSFAKGLIDKTDNALEACIQAFRQGEIVAVKGVGGYHLMCDASNDNSVAKLRKRKGRPDKPLAVMFPASGKDDLDAVRQVVSLSDDEADLLRSPARPIVLVAKKQDQLSGLIAPGLGEVGIMLAYSPLHSLLLEGVGGALVATSANLSGEPVLIDGDDIEQRLSHITTHFLHHNRRIVRPADDSVFRNMAGVTRPFRLGRGHAPIEITLPFEISEPIISCGGHTKNTIALAWGNRLVVSPHIGDLDSPRSMEVYEQTIEDLQRLYQVKATSLVCDLHPAYASSRWAAAQDLPLLKVQHHQAHASALVLEHWDDEPWLVFSWDGTGYGDDGTIWGGEAFVGRPGEWLRVASLRDFRLPGGEKAGREPWRSAAALCWEEGTDWDALPEGSELLKQAWLLGMNAPKTSAVGRLFDAASALTGLIDKASFEGQGPMLLEQACGVLKEAEALPITADEFGVLRADWASLIPEMIEEKNIGARATLFHSRLAHTLLKQVELIRKDYAFSKVGLCGGVFQNRKLTDYICKELSARNIDVEMSHRLPVNDAGISAGQIVEAAMRANPVHTLQE